MTTIVLGNQSYARTWAYNKGPFFNGAYPDSALYPQFGPEQSGYEGTRHYTNANLPTGSYWPEWLWGLTASEGGLFRGAFTGPSLSFYDDELTGPVGSWSMDYDDSEQFVGVTFSAPNGTATLNAARNGVDVTGYLFPGLNSIPGITPIPV